MQQNITDENQILKKAEALVSQMPPKEMFGQLVYISEAISSLLTGFHHS